MEMVDALKLARAIEDARLGDEARKALLCALNEAFPSLKFWEVGLDAVRAGYFKSSAPLIDERKSDEKSPCGR